MSAPNDELLQAIELALAAVPRSRERERMSTGQVRVVGEKSNFGGNWDAAHQIVQQYEDGMAAWIHAVLHKMEGDPGNARYWYRRADRMEHVEDEPRAELAAIQAELRSEQ
jgi:hypothetical protein